MDSIFTKVTRTAAETAKGILLSVENWKHSPVIENVDHEKDYKTENGGSMNDTHPVRHLIPDPKPYTYGNISSEGHQYDTDISYRNTNIYNISNYTTSIKNHLNIGFGEDVQSQSSSSLLSCDYCDFQCYEMVEIVRHMKRHRVLY